MNIDEHIRDSIIDLAKRYHINKVILFGSRARGDNKGRSDIDLAVTGGNITEFRLSIDDEIRTLLMFDVVNLDEPVQKPLLQSIEREGIILYEKV